MSAASTTKPPSLPPWDKFPPHALYKEETCIDLVSVTHPFSVRAEIIKQKGIGLERYSQVVLLKIIEIVGDDEFKLAEQFAIGKFYDPLYALEWHGRDVEVCTWSKEAERIAYEKLHILQGSLIPRFYGEYVYQRSINVGISIWQSFPVLLVEYIEAPLLLHLTGKLSPIELQTLKTKLESALKLIHEHNIYHYDFKAYNILWRNGEIVVIDFGAAQNPDTEKERMVGHFNDVADMEVVFRQFGIPFNSAFDTY